MREAPQYTTATANVPGSRHGLPSRNRAMLVHVLWACCLIATVPGIMVPPLAGLLGASYPWRFLWQPVTAAFAHGFAGMPAILHLVANSFLILTCGVWAERLLGTARFGLMTAAALASFATAQLASGIRVNGSSVLYYAWGAVLLVAWWDRRGGRAAGHRIWDQVKGVMAILYLVIPVMMAGFVYLAGFRGNPLTAALLGNTFHLTATLTGAPLAWLYRRRLRDRAFLLEDQGAWRREGATTADRAVFAVGILLGAFMCLVVLSGIFGWLP